MNAIAAKFAREAKNRPADWVIQQTSRGYKLAYIGKPGERD